MKRTRKLKPIHFFVPITRVNEEERIVEGYAFVNEVVEGEGGVRLKRTAMEAATPDYLRWGAVRAMHQPVAAGTATAPGCGIEWDEQGAFLRAKIVDDQEWKKVQAGVYKGFSVGVIPRMMRGKDVEQCVWAENSLVDRPKDPDSIITAFRAEGVDLEAEVEVEVEDEAPADEPIERAAGASFGELVAEREPQNILWLAFDLLRMVLWRLARHGGQDTDSLARESIQQFADYVVPLLTRADVDGDCCYYAAQAELTRLLETPDTLPEPLRGALAELAAERPEPPDLTRLTTLESENQGLLTRLETAETDLAAVRCDLAAAEERVRTLERSPAPGRSPVRFPAALERTFQANDGDRAEIQRLREEMETLTGALRDEQDPQKRHEGIIRLQTLKMQLAGAS